MTSGPPPPSMASRPFPPISRSPPGPCDHPVVAPATVQAVIATKASQDVVATEAFHRRPVPRKFVRLLGARIALEHASGAMRVEYPGTVAVTVVELLPGWDLTIGAVLSRSRSSSAGAWATTRTVAWASQPIEGAIDRQTGLQDPCEGGMTSSRIPAGSQPVSYRPRPSLPAFQRQP